MKKAKPKKTPPSKDLRILYWLVRDYCRRERKDEDVGSHDMVEAWHEICRRVGVNPNPRWVDVPLIRAIDRALSRLKRKGEKP